MRLGRALDTVGCSNRQGCVECMRVGRVLSACPWSTCSQAHQIHLHARVATPAPPAPSASSWSAQRGTPCSVETVQRCSYVGFGRQARWSRPRGGARSTSASSFLVPTAGAPIGVLTPAMRFPSQTPPVHAPRYTDTGCNSCLWLLGVALPFRSPLALYAREDHLPVAQLRRRTLEEEGRPAHLVAAW